MGFWNFQYLWMDLKSRNFFLEKEKDTEFSQKEAALWHMSSNRSLRLKGLMCRYAEQHRKSPHCVDFILCCVLTFTTSCQLLKCFSCFSQIAFFQVFLLLAFCMSRFTSRRWDRGSRKTAKESSRFGQQQRFLRWTAFEPTLRRKTYSFSGTSPDTADA